MMIRPFAPASKSTYRTLLSLLRYALPGVNDPTHEPGTIKGARTGTVLMLAGLLTARVGQMLSGDETLSPAQDKIFETDITKDLTISSGEPQIAVDPTSPSNLAIIEFSIGSSKVPAYSMNPIIDRKTPEQQAAATIHTVGSCFRTIAAIHGPYVQRLRTTLRCRRAPGVETL
jgi:hypothetical protein